MSRVIVLTDLHITMTPDAHRPDADAGLARAIRHINAEQAEADLLILTGDLTDKGDAASYAKLARHLESAALPAVLMLGNHDNRKAFVSVFPDAPVCETGHVQRVIDLPEARLICLDTLNGPPYDYPASHSGRLCEARLDWMEGQLSGTALPCILFMHHPPHDTGFTAMDTIKLLDGPAFYDRLAAHDNVAHIICGHVHRTISGSHRGIPFSVFKSPVGQMPMLFDVMDFHVETPEPPAYGIVDIHPDGITVHTEDFGLTDLGAMHTASER